MFEPEIMSRPASGHGGGLSWGNPNTKVRFHPEKGRFCLSDPLGWRYLGGLPEPAIPRVVTRTPEHDQSLLSTTLIGTTLEIPTATPELVDALKHDSQVLVRDALLWQRGVRLFALVAVSALALVFGEASFVRMAIPIAITAIAYALIVEISSRLIRRTVIVHQTTLPAALVTADIGALSAIVWSCSMPYQMGRILLGASLVVQLATFYFGRKLGFYAAVLSGFAYLLTARVLPPAIVSGAPAISQLLFTLGLFWLISAVMISAYGNFRVRMNRLRLFCKLVEEGDLAPTLSLGDDKRPDDLTLLSRSFEGMRARLAEQIGTDPLTGCLNRRALETRLRTEWRQAKRRSSNVAVLAIDMDHFKQINDTRGHPFGDVVLQELAGIMKSTARDTDAVARLGGDEFVIVLPDTGWQGALTFAERLRRKVDDFAFGSSHGAIGLTISVGVALARGSDPISPEILLQEADRSLYKAKSGGRNRIFA
jgi:diguanylate cyclase (GGDEF)-like protein